MQNGWRHRFICVFMHIFSWLYSSDRELWLPLVFDLIQYFTRLSVGDARVWRSGSSVPRSEALIQLSPYQSHATLKVEPHGSLLRLRDKWRLWAPRRQASSVSGWRWDGSPMDHNVAVIVRSPFIRWLLFPSYKEKGTMRRNLKDQDTSCFCCLTNSFSFCHFGLHGKEDNERTL